MKDIVINKKKYEVIEDYKNCIDIEIISNLLTEYFDEFDYILGDYSYGKLRLKGFYETNNKKSKQYNEIGSYKKYLKEFCASDCAYFLIKST